MISESYGATAPLPEPKQLSQSNTGRKVGAALFLLIVAAIGYTSLYPIQPLGANRQYNVEADAQRITIQYSYDEMMAYADDMSPGSTNLQSFHAELIESEGIAEIDRAHVQFKVIDPSEARQAAIEATNEYLQADNSDIDLEADRTRAPRTKRPRPTKGPKPTKAPRTKRPKRTKAPKPTKPMPTDSGLDCYTVLGGSSMKAAPSGFSRLEAMCPTGIRTGCSAKYNGALHEYKGNWGVTAVYEGWTPDADQGCTAGYYGEDKEGEFQVQARCCEDADGKLGVAIKKGQTKTEVLTKFDSDNEEVMCLGMDNSEVRNDGKMYTGCTVSGDITMDPNGGTWSGSLDPGFGGVRRRPDGTCKGQSFSDAKYETCTGKDVSSGTDCMDTQRAVIYLDEEDVVYMNSVMHDREKIHAYKETLIQNAGYSVNDVVKFEIEADETADWLKADCGGGYWASWRDTEGWNLQAISTPECVDGNCWSCTIVDADWAVENSKLGLYESVVGCSKQGGGMSYDHGELVDCSGYLDDQIDECDDKKSMKRNYGSYYDGDLCKAQSSSSEIRAQAVCCTFG